jgi:vanillate O-demethylase monooxygenase subunit
VRHGDRTAQVERWMLNIDPPPFWRFQLGQKIKADGKVDRWQYINYEAPAAICLDVGVALAGTGAPQGDRSQGVTARVCHFITPETERTCFFFWVVRRNFNLDDPELTVATRDKNAAIVAEDEAVLTAQQIAMEENPDAVFYNLNIDGGAMWARRVLEKMMDAERAPPALHAAE